MWQYTDSTQRVVFRTNADGTMESHSVDAEVIKEWLASENIPLPANGSQE